MCGPKFCSMRISRGLAEDLAALPAGAAPAAGDVPVTPAA